MILKYLRLRLSDSVVLAPPMPAVAVSTAEIGHLHHLWNHAHQLAATAAAAHAREASATHVRPVTVRRVGCTAAETAGSSAAAVLHHPAHHRSHGLHQHAEAALAHLGLHHVEHRRHLGHHVLTAAAVTEAAELCP